MCPVDLLDNAPVLCRRKMAVMKARNLQAGELFQETVPAAPDHVFRRPEEVNGPAVSQRFGEDFWREVGPVQVFDDRRTEEFSGEVHSRSVGQHETRAVDALATRRISPRALDAVHVGEESFSRAGSA